MSAFQPFGIGRHSCIGVKLAYAEMRYILARLLFAFDISLADSTDKFDWGDQETHIFWVGPSFSRPNCSILMLAKGEETSTREVAAEGVGSVSTIGYL